MVDNGHAPLIAVRNRPRVVHPFGRFPPGFFLPLPFVNEIVRICDTTGVSCVHAGRYPYGEETALLGISEDHISVESAELAAMI